MRACTAPTCSSAPAAMVSTPLTNRPSTRVPLHDPRSSIVHAPAATTSRA